jgi:galactonate dehydratase
MKITAIKPFLVDRFLLVRVYTDGGIVGNGEAGLWAHHEVTAKAIQSVSEYYIGKDPGRIDHHYQTVSRNTHFFGAVLSSALSAIDIALWDILGKTVNKPVHELLGGRCRDKVRVFANVKGETLPERAASAREALEQGYASLRTTPFFAGWEAARSSSRTIGDAVAIVHAIREEIGKEVDMGLELHRNLTTQEAVTLAQELAPYRILYYEDPVPPENEGALEYVASRAPIPIAAGERNTDLHQFSRLLDRHLLAFLRFDVSLAGGITQGRKIASAAEAQSVQVIPHLMGSPVNTAAYVQLDAAIPNYHSQEANLPTPPAAEIVDEPLKLIDGYLEIPEGPGIGVEIREEALGRFPFKPNRIKGNFYADGSVRH